MKVRVNHYMYSHEGKIYQEGEIIDIADKQLAISLVENSKGNLEFCREDFAKAATIDNVDIEETGELPDVDTSATIGKKGKK